MSSCPHQQFTSLYRAHYDSCLQKALHITRCPYTAEDIVQDVFATIWSKEQGSSDIHDWPAYLSTMVHNRSIDLLRKQKLRDHIDSNYTISLTGNTTEEMVNYRHLDQEYRHALSTLTQHRRAVFVLSRMKGWSRHHIASRLNITINTVKSTMQNALAHLNQHLPHEDN
jgi:RNA polymerase sigma-70 factor (ECF subfamily)